MFQFEKCPVCNKNFKYNNGFCFCKKCQYRNFIGTDSSWEEIIFKDMDIYVANYYNRDHTPKQCTILNSKDGKIVSLDNKIIINNFNLKISNNKKEMKDKIKQLLAFS